MLKKVVASWPPLHNSFKGIPRSGGGGNCWAFSLSQLRHGRVLVPPLPSPFSTHIWSCACAPFSPYEPARLGSHDAPLSASARIRMAFFRAKETSLAITELAASNVCLFAGTSASTHYRMHHVIIVYSWQLSFCSLSPSATAAAVTYGC